MGDQGKSDNAPGDPGLVPIPGRLGVPVPFKRRQQPEVPLETAGPFCAGDDFPECRIDGSGDGERQLGLDFLYR
ncbi:hypothetical protein D3C81_2010160 [compost metagenome]